MEIVDAYLPLRHTHVGLVILSVALFAVRGLGVMAAAAWPRRRPLRRASILIDSALLASGLGLWALLGLNPLTQAWFGVKLALLPLYVGLGMLALGRARTPLARGLSGAAALACVAFMASIAVAHDPRGVFAGA